MTSRRKLDILCGLTVLPWYRLLRGSGPYFGSQLQSACDVVRTGIPEEEVARRMDGSELNATSMARVQVVDSHTGGEPTRVVVDGGPDLGAGSIADRRIRFRDEFDAFRSAVVNEPRGSEVLVGALLCEPVAATSVAGAIFFNNVGVLGMCGHGTIGVAVTLAHLGRITAGQHTLETAFGDVPFELHDDLQRVTLTNVASYRHARQVTVDVAGHGAITGDVAWGGNWFFLVQEHGQQILPSRAGELRDFSLRIREALGREGVTGRDGAEIDHIELFASNGVAGGDSRNFVLCPGGAWDRSPCGTGTSAKLACLAADHKLAAGQIWRQESLIGSLFEASYQPGETGEIIPSITGSAWVTAESTLLLDPRDPFRAGIPT